MACRAEYRWEHRSHLPAGPVRNCPEGVVTALASVWVGVGAWPAGFLLHLGETNTSCGNGKKSVTQQPKDQRGCDSVLPLRWLGACCPKVRHLWAGAAQPGFPSWVALQAESRPQPHFPLPQGFVVSQSHPLLGPVSVAGGELGVSTASPGAPPPGPQGQHPSTPIVSLHQNVPIRHHLFLCPRFQQNSQKGASVVPVSRPPSRALRPLPHYSTEAARPGHQ